MKQKNHHFSYSIAVHQTRLKVWNYLTNVERWKEWDTELIESKLHEAFAVGAKGELLPRRGPKLAFHIDEITPLESYTFITQMPIGQFIITRRLQERDRSVVFTDEIKFTGFLKHLFGLVLGIGFRKVLPGVMQQFKIIVEKE